MMGRLGRKTRQGINWWKTSQLMKETKEENRKIIKYRYCQWKNLPTWTKDRKGKSEIDKEGSRLIEKRGVFSRRDLGDKGLSQIKVLCSSSKIEMPMVNYHVGFPVLPAPEKQISGYLPASGSSRSILA